ncbi:hypothetical protein K491DRAFT_61315 [Lophiostoma macrostomum CBS 122681]|uniref:GPI-anchored cell wall organization protein Ecm33 n=1 Tax=Lophiostoma macrostomum CBS 122681 TaxID=1314788 RepID=A0A6A6TMS2_9PLEO|nr:hypothetical protein K491DRAFT_61315 [Lophiostoma macrostomum CBS 122681]
MKLCGRTLVCSGILGLIGVVGAFDCAPSSKSYTIKTAQDAADIITCPTFTGSIIVAADGPKTVSLDGISSILGNIDIENSAQLQSLSSSTLTAVASFTLNNLPKLSNLSFPALTNFSSLTWSNLPSLTECTVATGAVQGEIQDVTIYNTSLKALDWLKWPIGTGLNISNNANLQAFDIPYSAINAGSALTFSNNPNLTTIDVSRLTGIYGGLDVTSNTQVLQMAFDNLEIIGGFVQLSGAFTNVSMPAMSRITGAFTVRSTGDITNLCNSLEKQQLTGHYTCMPNADAHTTTSGGSATPTSTSTSDSDDSSEADSNNGGLGRGEIAGVVIACIVSAILALVAAFFYFRRRLRAKVQEITQKKDANDSDSSLDRHSRKSWSRRA